MSEVEIWLEVGLLPVSPVGAAEVLSESRDGHFLDPSPARLFGGTWHC